MSLRKLITCCLLSLSFSTLAGEALFTLEDPRGDDFGTGALRYPSGSDFEKGDLDLLAFSAERDKKGTWFEVTFANKIRSPKNRTSKMGNVPLSELARHEFYTFNVDIYIDTDGYEGSGNTHTLPGRKIRVADSTAWEKGIFLTPRPHLAASWMKKHLAKQVGGDKAAQKAAELAVDESYFFPTRIKVRGKSIRFFVPGEFLGGPADRNWRYLVLVTGADPEQKMDIAFFKQKRSGLMMMPLNNGRPFETFQLDYDADPNQPPIVDVLLPTEELQRQLLSRVNAEDDYRAILGGMTARAGTAPPLVESKAPTLAEKQDDDKIRELARAEREQQEVLDRLAKLKAMGKSPSAGSADHDHDSHAGHDHPAPVSRDEHQDQAEQKARQLAEAEKAAREEALAAKAEALEAKALARRALLLEQFEAQNSAEAKAEQKQHELESDHARTRAAMLARMKSEEAADAKAEQEQESQRSVSERLRELEKLREEQLISEEEYLKLRKKILEDL